MKTCTRCGGNLYVPYAYGCRHDFGEAVEEGGVRIAFDPTPSRRAPVGWTVEVERADLGEGHAVLVPAGADVEKARAALLRLEREWCAVFEEGVEVVEPPDREERINAVLWASGQDARTVARRQVFLAVRNLGGITASRVVELAGQVRVDSLHAKRAIEYLAASGLIEWNDDGFLVECVD